MQAPTIKLRTAARTAVNSAMTTAGYTAACFIEPDPDQTLPYVLISDVTVYPRHNKTHEGHDSTHLFIAWSTTVDDAEALANVIMTALVNRSSPISVDSSVKLCYYDLDSMGPLLTDDLAGDGKAYGVPVRIRYKTHE